MAPMRRLTQAIIRSCTILPFQQANTRVSERRVTTLHHGLADGDGRYAWRSAGTPSPGLQVDPIPHVTMATGYKQGWGHVRRRSSFSCCCFVGALVTDRRLVGRRRADLHHDALMVMIIFCFLRHLRHVERRKVGAEM